MGAKQDESSSLWQNTVSWIESSEGPRGPLTFDIPGTRWFLSTDKWIQNKGWTVVKPTVGGFRGRVLRSGTLVLTDKEYKVGLQIENNVQEFKEYKVGLQIENNVQEFTVWSILAHCMKAATESV